MDKTELKTWLQDSFTSLASDGNLDLNASPVAAVISSDVLNTLGKCLVQVVFLNARILFLFNSLVTVLSKRLVLWSSSVMAGRCSGEGKTPLTQKELPVAERLSGPCQLKLIARVALNSGCAASHGVGFWPLAWLSDCYVVCLQW